LWESKVLIFVVALAVTCIAGAYAFLSTPIYQTTTKTLPPTTSGLASYNIASQLTGASIRGTVADVGPGIDPLKPQQAYKVFLRHLNSSTIRQKFFGEYYLPAQGHPQTEGDKQRAWERLNNQLTISLPKSADEDQASLTLEGTEPQTIADWANAYVKLAKQAASEELTSGLAGEVEIRKQSLNDQIAALRKIAKNVREDRIVRLQDALIIAQSIDLHTPLENAPLITINTDDPNAESINSGSLLYLRGTKALQSELDQLKSRETDDAYISEMPGLLKKQALLNNISLNPSLLSAAIIDQAAIAPEQPIKPRKILIIALGLILGLILGIFSALIGKAMQR